MAPIMTMTSNLDRRRWLKTLGWSATAFALGRAQEVGSDVTSVKALVFDTFGTIVDWRGSIIEEGEQWGKSKGLRIDWARFADRWRAGYGPSMDKVRKGEIPGPGSITCTGSFSIDC